MRGALAERMQRELLGETEAPREAWRDRLEELGLEPVELGAETATGRLLLEMGRELDPDWTEQVVPFPGYRDAPVGFALEVLRIEFLTGAQKRIMRRVRDRPETTVQAGNSVGKSFAAAVLVLWWVYSRGGLAITTAPTFQLVKDVLWHEVRRLYERNETKLGGRCLETQVRLTEEARAYGYTASQRAEAVAFGGRHADEVLAVQDESSGVSREIDDVFDSLLTGTGNRALRIGNPLGQGSAFEEHCRKRGTIVVPVWEHPNVEWAYEAGEDGVRRLRPNVDERLPRDDEGMIRDERHWPDDLPRSRVAGAVSVQWIEKERQKPSHAPGTPWWQQHLDAEWADDPVGSLVPRSWWQAARARYDAEPDAWDERATGHRWEHGLDVGDGGDPHALVSRRGPVVYHGELCATQGDMRDVDRAVMVVMRWICERWGIVKVDRGASGSGVVQQLRKQMVPFREPPEYEDWAAEEQAIRAVGVAWGAAAEDSTQFVNLKAEAFWKLRTAFREETIAVAPLPPDVEQQLKEELSSIRWELTAADKVKLEPKAETKRRLGRSPDLADALAYAWWLTGLEMEITVGGYGRGDTVPGAGRL